MHPIRDDESRYVLELNMKIICMLLVVLSFNAFSANVTSERVITSIYTYGKDNGASQNIIAIKVADPVQFCDDGFWLSPEDNLENKSIAAFLLSAFHTGSTVYFAGYTDQLWAGEHCKIHSVGLKK
jgi:hypothetical protein